MKWHRATETPRPDTEVLAEVKGFEHNKFIVLQWTKEGWWQHIPRMNDIMPSDGWIGTQGLFVIRWAYIAEKDLALTWEDVRTILDKENDILHECNDNAQQVIEVYPKEEDYYGEILKRFNEQRKK